MKVFYDVDTQNDFMNSNGALYVPDAELIKPNLILLTDYAEGEKYNEKRFPIIGSVDRHFGSEEYKEREGELAKWGGPFPDHCMDKSEGYRKIAETFLWTDNFRGDGCSHTSLYMENRLDSLIDYKLMQKALETIRFKYQNWGPSAVYFEKQSYDVFTNPAIDCFLRLAKIDEAVVYGVATDYCVKAAVLGMQERGIKCYVVEDAIKGVFPESTQKALEEMTNAGAELVTTQDVLEGRI
ncbi:MAG: isochorismatase family protein [Nanoarchaeota archaeon]|nr:isochorismatase family protein [Nanoarchaeota archaeon]